MTMLQYSNFYYRYGTRKASQFLMPRIWSSEDIMLPFDTEFHWFTISDVLEPLNKNSGILKNINKGIVHSVLEYDMSNISGNFRLKPSIPNNIIREFAQAEKRLRFLKYNQEVKVSNRIAEIYHYGGLTHRYLYISQPLKRLHVYRNSLNTLITNMYLKTSRNIFFKFDLPQELPSRVELDKYSKKITNGYLKLLPNYKYLNIVELWKYLTPDLRETSIFNRIPTNMLEKTTICFSFDSKVVFLNMGFLVSFIEEYSQEVQNINTGLKHVKANLARKIIYIFLYRILKNNPIIDIEENDKINKNFSPLGTVPGSGLNVKSEEHEEVKEVDIDKLLSSSVEERSIDMDTDTANDEDSIDTSDDFDQVDEDTTGFEFANAYNENNELTQTMVEVKSSENVYDNVSVRAELLYKNKLISKKDLDHVTNAINEQKTKLSPYKEDSKITVGEMLDDKKDDLDIDHQELNITDNPAVIDKSYNKNKVNSIKKQYLTKQYRKDMLRVIYSLQNHSSLIEDYNVETKESILGSTEEHTIKVKTLGSGTSNIKLILPTINQDGVYVLNGNSYLIRQQRADLPIRKIDFNTVALSTFYGKTFITKATTKANDKGYWLLNQIMKIYSDPNSSIKNLVTTPPNTEGLNLPKLYGLFARYIKSFKFHNVQYSFDYENRIRLFSKMTKDDLDKIENKKYVIVANDKGFPILIDYDNNFFKYTGKIEPYENILDKLGINSDDFPLEFTSVKIYKKNIPTVVFLSYYLGLDNLLKLLKSNYVIHPSNKHPVVENGYYRIKFKDIQYVIKKDNGIGDLILGGLVYLKDVLKNIDVKVMNNRNDFSVLFTRLDLSVLYINEIKLMENMYVDPISLSLLKQMKEPTNFKGLIIRSNELLMDDNYTNPNSIDGMSIKGYERIPGMMYKEIINSLKEFENKSYFSKSKITINPYSIMNKLNEDSTTVLIDDLNPMATIKQEEDVTFLGMNGRTKETLSRNTRNFNTNEVGIISEATRDSGDVGISAYLTADPLLDNIRGMVGTYDGDKDHPVNVFSSSAMLSPFCLMDDGKRVNNGSL